jgi:hypothetical protein
MATVKRYRVFCHKCRHHFAVFAALFHTISAEQWMKEKADNHDCKAHAEALAKARAPRPVNPLKASKKS